MKGKIHINEAELYVYRAIDEEISCGNNSDTIILIQFYDNHNDIAETRLIRGDSRRYYDFNKGIFEYYENIPELDSVEEQKIYHILMYGRSAENLEKVITTWQFDSIADMLLYSGSYYRSTLGYLYCDRIIISHETITDWERIVINNVFFWYSPSLIEQMPIEFKQDSMVKASYRRYLDEDLRLLKKENAPIEDIKSRKFWHYYRKN